METPQLSGIQGKHFLPARTGSRDNCFSPEIIFLLQAIRLVYWNPKKRRERRGDQELRFLALEKPNWDGLLSLG